jgi:hypothetical protein
VQKKGTAASLCPFTFYIQSSRFEGVNGTWFGRLFCYLNEQLSEKWAVKGA